MAFLSILLVSVIAFLNQVQSDCLLDLKDEQIAKRIFITEGPNSEMSLHLSEKVQNGVTLKMFCNDDDIVDITCETNNIFSISESLKTCEAPTKAYVEKRMQQHSSCSTTLYEIGFEIQGRKVPLYLSCYDATNMKTYFTVHLVVQNNLNVGRPNTQDWTLDKLITGKKASSFMARNIHARFEKIFGRDQKYIKNDIRTSRTEYIINRGHLVPSNDYIFPRLMRTTFKYLNVAAQLGSINRSNWKVIENFVRKLNHPAKVCTGTMDVLELQNTPIYLYENNINPIPKWFYKIISTNHEQYVFLISNNIFSATPPQPICTSVNCPASITLKNEPEAGFAFCCDYSDFIKSNNLGICENTNNGKLL